MFAAPLDRVASMEVRVGLVKAEELFRGVGVALVTIFSRSGEADPAATAKHAADLVSRGMRAVLVAGTTGEAGTLTQQERTALIEAVRAAIPAEIPVLAGTGAATAETAVSLTAAAARAGADVILAYPPPGSAGLPDFYAAVGNAAAGLAVLAYHVPWISAPGVPVDELAGLPVAGIKDSSGSPDRLLDELAHYKGSTYVGSSAMAGLKHGIAVPCFGSDPAGLVELGVATERAGFDGYFLWDHIVFSNTGDGPPIVDPWLVLSVVAARTSRISIGTVVTPVPRRRPWQLARTTTTLDRLSGGRVVLGVGIGSPAYGDFGIFHEPSGDRERAELLDEGLDVLAGLWSGERFSYSGKHLTVDPVRFLPVPVQRPRIPVWVAGVLPATRPIARAARWDGMVPIRFDADGL